MLSAVLLTLVAVAAAAPADTSADNPVAIQYIEEPRKETFVIPLLKLNIIVDETDVGKKGPIVMVRQDVNKNVVLNSNGTWSLDKSEELKVSLSKDSSAILSEDEAKQLTPTLFVSWDDYNPKSKSIAFRLADFTDDNGTKNVITIKNIPEPNKSWSGSVDYVVEGGPFDGSIDPVGWTFDSNKVFTLTPQ